MAVNIRRRQGKMVGWSLMLALLLALTFTGSTWAANPVVTLGANLTHAQRQQMLTLFGVRRQIIRQYIINNTQEHQLLNGIAPASEIGTRSISSAYVVPERVGYGLQVWTHNITWVTASMYANALATAGLTNATVRVAAPFPVSGTAALAGIIWAYQASTGRHISTFQQRTAAREMVVTGTIGHRTGQVNQTVEMMRVVKEAVVGRHLTSRAEIRPVIVKAAAGVHLHLTTAEITQITAVMMDISRLHLSVSQIHQQVSGLRNEAAQAGAFWNVLLRFFHWVWSLITGHGITPGATRVDGRSPHSLDSKQFRP